MFLKQIFEEPHEKLHENLHFSVDYPVTLQNGTFEQLATKSTTLLKPDFLCFLSSKYLFMHQ